MPLPAVVDSLDAIPDAVRDQYKPDGTRFVLDVTGAEEVFAAGLKRNRDEVLSEKTKLEQRLKAYEGLDPAKAREALEAASKAEEEKARAAGNFDALRAQLVERHGQELEGVTAKLTKREAFIHKVLAENVAVQAIGAAEGNTKLLLPHVLQHVRVVEDPATGEFAPQVVDARGNVRIANAKGEPMSITDLVAEMRGQSEYAGAFKGSGASGSGAAGSSTPAVAAGTVRSKADLTTAAAKSAFIGEHGYDAFVKLPAK